jgi:hypothetical protein
MNIKSGIVILLASILLAACSTLLPTPTATSQPSPTFTVPATLTPSPSPSPLPSATPKPTSTSEPSATPESAALPMPEGTPAVEWGGAPVMPGATAGQGDEDGYLFVIQASVKEIQAYYENELEKLGWSLLGAGDGKNGNMLLIFQKDADTFSIAIINPGRADGLLQVMLVQ